MQSYVGSPTDKEEGAHLNPLRISDKIHAQQQQFHFIVLYPIPILYPMKTHDLKKKLSMQAKNALKTKNYDNYPCNPKLVRLSVKTHA